MTVKFTASPQHEDSRGHRRNTLVARASVARTFDGLGAFLVFVFLGAGVYLLQEAFSDPLRAEAVGLITEAFILATATILLYFVFSPWPRYRRREVSRRTLSRAPSFGQRSPRLRRCRRYQWPCRSGVHERKRRGLASAGLETVYL